MSAPEIAELPDATEADPPASEAAESTAGRRIGRRGVAIIAGSVVLVAVAGVVTTLLVTAHLDRQDALAEVEAARATSLAASAELRAAQHEHSAVLAELESLLATADAVAAITGPGIDPAATEALLAARGTLAIPTGEAPALTPAGTVDLATASTPELQEYAAAHDRYASRLADAVTSEGELVTRLTEVSTTATSALADYTTATVAAGAALLADRADAADDLESAVQSSLDLLPTATPDELPGMLAAYRAAVDAVVASSDKARAPARSGHIGTGIDDPTSLTVVVNKRRALPAGYAPTDLRRPAGVGNALPLRAVAAGAAERMAADMAAVGIQLRMSSGYRSYSRQQTIYNGFVAREGVAGADEHSARPGFSEHQTGLAADFDDGTGCNLNVCFRDRAGGIWLAENAWKYGFIQRYGDGWQPTVGYRFEPWHYRYVGETVAADMHERGVTSLEEYFGLGAAPDYG